MPEAQTIKFIKSKLVASTVGPQNYPLALREKVLEFQPIYFYLILC